MKNIIFISFIIGCLYNSVIENDALIQESNKIIDLLKPKRIDFKSSQIIQSYFVGFTTTNSTDSLNLIKIPLSKKHKLELYTYEYLPSNYGKFHHEYLEYNGKQIYIDSLLYKSHNSLIEKDPYISITEINDFDFNGDNFILLSCQNRNFYHNGIIKSYILVQLNGTQVEGSWMFYNAYEDKNVFADYDKDGHMEYLSWRLNSDTINVYKLNGKCFSKDETHYLKLKSNKNVTKDNLDWLSKIDYKKSKWFFKLKRL